MTAKRTLALLVLMLVFAAPTLAGDIEIPPAPTGQASTSQTSVEPTADDTTVVAAVEIIATTITSLLSLPR